ncbi:MAG TPA: tetratricopeptide repeat protein [Deltaproteobacteria bacterium]|nr:tetratricopeptide repeat protein [Deltaproteobacteria bacterium]
MRLLAALLAALTVSACSHFQVPVRQTEEPDNPRLLMMLARLEENRGNLVNALYLYARVGDPYAELAKARVYFMMDDSVAALASLQKVIDEGTYTQEALEQRIRIHARGGNWPLAMQDMLEIARKHPENVQIQMNLANLCIITQDFERAKTVLKGLIGKADDALVHYTMAKACLGERDFACSKEELNKSIEAKSDFVPAYLDLARIHTLLGETAQAEATYLRLLDVDPLSSEAHLALVDHYIQQKRYREAVDHLETFYELNPQAQVLRKLVVLELQEGLFEKALAHIRDIKDMTEDDKYYLALTYAGLERYEEALNTLNEISVSGRLGCETAMLASSVLKSMNRDEESIAVLESAWKEYGQTGTCNEIGYQLATELDTAGRRDDGLRIAMELLEKDGKDPIALNFVGYVWADRGVNLDDAYRMIKEALSAKPDDPYILDSMAWVLHRLGRNEEALGYITRSLEKIGDDPTVNEHMGDILKALGRMDKALDYYLKSSILSRSTTKDLKDKIIDFLRQDRMQGTSTQERSIP